MSITGNAYTPPEEGSSVGIRLDEDDSPHTIFNNRVEWNDARPIGIVLDPDVVLTFDLDAQPGTQGNG